jgi:hypothetical protein
MNLFGSDKRDEYSAAIMDSSNSSSALIAVYYSAFSPLEDLLYKSIHHVF